MEIQYFINESKHHLSFFYSIKKNIFVCCFLFFLWRFKAQRIFYNKMSVEWILWKRNHCFMNFPSIKFKKISLSSFNSLQYLQINCSITNVSIIFVLLRDFIISCLKSVICDSDLGIWFNKYNFKYFFV